MFFFCNVSHHFKSPFQGLVVPVIRDADNMNFADIEKGINSLAKKATEGALSIDDMAGGTFTISNGGVYGSLISTPIINPPQVAVLVVILRQFLLQVHIHLKQYLGEMQSAILGMHSIVQRPVVVNDNILARPMMYLALTYDHRLIDGREAVFFLRRIKDVVEDPRRLLLDIWVHKSGLCSISILFWACQKIIPCKILTENASSERWDFSLRIS
jgi:2-oxoglutarate dehydrogenase E2 component (dihydrolipoamide succinyltransferase)